MNNTGGTKPRATRPSKAHDTEDSVEGYLLKRVKELGGITIKLPAIFYPGIPDRLILLPSRIVGFAELKRPKGGKFEPGQPMWLRRLARLGFPVAVPRTKEQVDEFLESLT